MTLKPSMKFSIVTPSYQHAEYIEQTIRSVVEQDYPHVEYRVIDGGSTDETLQILRRYEDKLKWVSEPDRGQTDAINKGFVLARGDILGWLNADDYYAPGALRTVAEYFTAHADAVFVYGDAVGIDRKGRKYGARIHIRARQQIDESDFDILVNRYDFLVQPACFWRASLWRDLGDLDVNLRYSMDYEYWMRVAKRYRMDYLPVTLAYERLYGQAKTGTGDINRIEEIEQVAVRHGGTGLPRNYHAEAAAYYTLRALRRIFNLSLLDAQADMRRVVTLKPMPIKYVRFLAVMLIMGRHVIPAAWLWLNRWRTFRSKFGVSRLSTSDESPPM